MKSVLFGLLITLATAANAGQVYTLNVGQTLPLANNDVVICLGGNGNSATASTAVSCTLYIGGLQPFQGQGATQAEAKQDAERECDFNTRGQTFQDANKRYYNPCKSSGNPTYHGFQCK